ncbi:hypothetical protein [Massilia sp. BJB1822]|uniref:hypothetical protein n=1 Tax=Massilia sp. BJB1822 TaxID=2744470 RepID=UPI001592DAB9|nr:hypothetical protein [Massilia sp. BJB1822]NVE00038.1 hypothetical protein [Massilia sp. BJB1822]
MPGKALDFKELSFPAQKYRIGRKLPDLRRFQRRQLRKNSKIRITQRFCTNSVDKIVSKGENKE